MVPFDRRQDQVNLWLLWVIAMAVGCALGWTLGEAFGRLAYHRFGWTIGHIVAWSTFEALVWSLRWFILRRLSTVPLWRRLDTWIWFGAELVAWSISEGIHQVTSTLWLTASAVWGVIGGAIIWAILVCAHQAKPGRWFVLRGTAYGGLGLLVGNLVFPITLVVVDEIQRTAATMAMPVVGWLAAGALLGTVAGSITGLAVARLWFKMLTSG